MKKAFTLLELIFAILILGIIASYAVPKFLHTKDSALSGTIKRDIISAQTAIQSYTLLNKEIENIDDAITLNSNNWELETSLKATFKDHGKDCITISVISEDGANYFDVKITDNSGAVCTKLRDLEKIVNTKYFLY